mgnify:CR=1 FL=1
MPNKPAYTITEQIALLKQRGMLFRDEEKAPHFFKNISYYRLKGYWWDMQIDTKNHSFKPHTYFEDIIERYNFDRHLRLILFDAIERIEIALRTKMINYMSIKYGGLWYLKPECFNIDSKHKSIHKSLIKELEKEFNRSKEIFITDHKRRFSNEKPDAWKILEIASLGVLSKLYKSINHQLPEKSAIANDMGLNSHKELASWLEAITYIRNVIAHHSRLWSRNMVKRPIQKLNNPSGKWFENKLIDVQSKKTFLIISCMIYLCNKITPGHQIKHKILDLFEKNPNIPIYKLGFLNNWKDEPIWK